MYLPIPCVSCKWNHTIRALLCPASFTWHNILGFIHIVDHCLYTAIPILAEFPYFRPSMQGPPRPLQLHDSPLVPWIPWYAPSNPLRLKQTSKSWHPLGRWWSMPSYVNPLIVRSLRILLEDENFFTSKPGPRRQIFAKEGMNKWMNEWLNQAASNPPNMELGFPHQTLSFSSFLILFWGP